MKGTGNISIKRIGHPRLAVEICAYKYKFLLSLLTI